MKKILTLLVVLLVAITLVGCGNQPPEQNETEQGEVDNTPTANFANIDEVWASYRTAVEMRDFDKLASMANFPVRSYGVHDVNPVILIGENEFASAFADFLDQSEGRGEGITNFDLIVQSGTMDFEIWEIDGVENTRGWMEHFERINGVWRLAAFYRGTQ